MEVRDDEVRVVGEEVERRAREIDTGEAADEEGEQEAKRHQHRGREPDFPSPHRADPVEHLDPRRHRNEETHDREEGQEDRAGREHVVSPHAQGQRADGDGREDHALVAENGLTREDGDDLGDHAKDG